MNPFIVVSEKNLIDHLIEQCYEQTQESTATGKFWKCLRTGKHILVPFSEQEMYPDFILKDLELLIGKVKPSIQ